MSSSDIKLNTNKPKLPHISNLCDTVKKLDDLGELEGIVVIMQGTDNKFHILAAHNGGWNKELMHLALKQALRKEPESVTTQVIRPN